MGGWKRLFIVTSAFIVLAAAIFAITEIPDDIHLTLGCEQLSYNEADAAEAIRTRSYEQIAGEAASCAASLNSIANGEARAEEMAHWRQGVLLLLAVVAGLLALIYAVGWSVGWVWRGFFPKKMSN